MPDFQGSVLGALLTLLGWDGTDFQNVKIDSDGHLQIDVLSTVLGGDQATETTLALVKDRIGALTTPAAGSTNKLLTDALTALQLIDDLRSALHDVGTDEIRVRAGYYDGDWFGLLQNAAQDLVVDVQETILPPGAATEASVQGIEDQVKGVFYNIQAGLFQKVTASAGAGNNWLTTTAVPAGEIHHITQMVSENATSTSSAIWSGTLIGGTTVYFEELGSTAAGILVVWKGDIWLEEGDQMRVLFGGCTASDALSVTVWGHKMGV